MDEAFLRANSRLPGPRANLELLSAAAEQVDGPTAARWAKAMVGADPTDVFVISVGLVACGRLAAEGDEGGLELMRQRANDAEWRIREAVAIGLQRLGDDRPDRLAEIAHDWVSGTPLEARAAVAGVAEPRLLKRPAAVDAALDVLEAATTKVVDSRDRVLRQALGYAWSVVVAADPERGLARFKALEERAASHPDIGWIVRENLGKSRMRKIAAG